jgi:hypothetical protein
MKYFYLSIICIISPILIYPQTIELFNQKKDELGLKYKQPFGFAIVDNVKQEDTLYDIGLRKNDDYELRIGIYPISMISHLESINNPDDIKKELITMTYVIGMNISQNNDLKADIKSYDENAVKKEFDADFGTYFVVNGNSNFSGKYQTVLITAIYKKGTGLIVVYHLFKDQEAFQKISKSIDFIGCYYSIAF